ncbi:sulfur carrier protein ThiS [Candidatus Methylospira mobilis]|uniref:Thiazole synthase n=1 Tax=Candidatus Methylospira mobilis TaxID=1808979 RepID=A0A5Q0BCM7_9GAMM|nr:sulfur carrier protein ThiS [Candidatus Methylospira mobilis]QFY41560.1 sulfur carrier protein ThiS [Candidatus Methylospira mobilis]WNV05199.1 sulfur carrier protein ThiS [Candidatus Methylospira mobilis]
MQLTVNGKIRSMHNQATLSELIAELELTGKRIAVELNREIIPQSRFDSQRLQENDKIEIVHAIGGGQSGDPLVIAGKTYQSRLLVGSGKYRDLQETKLATEASGAEIVTIAIRRSNIGQNPGEPNLLDVLPPERYTLLPNTAGCYSAEEAVRTCRLARELLGGHNLVKLEVLGDVRTLLPDIIATLEATRTLVSEGFDVMVYTNDDPIIAKRLEELGCVAVMPLAAPIGSGLGIRNPYNILTILENAKVPILVDAGVGTASDAAIAMELGCDGVLMNTAIAGAQNPVLMASAMRKAIEAGREAFRAGRIPRKRFASASSPVDGLIGE